MWQGIVKFADKNERWRADYEKLLRDLGVTLQIWSEILQSGTSAIARKCQSTCKVGTASPDWDPTPPPSPLPPDWETPFTYP